MTKTRFFEVFSALKQSDYRRFEDMVYSPFFNKNARVIKLWEYLKLKGEEEENFAKENIENVVFGKEKFTDANLRMVISSFVKLVEEYFLHKEYELNETESKIRLLEIFQKKGLTKSFSMYLNEIENELDKVKKKDAAYYYRKYFVECLKIASSKGGNKLAAREYVKKFSNLYNHLQ